MEIKEIYDLVKNSFEKGIGDLKSDVPVDPFFFVDSEFINQVGFFLRDEESLQFDYMMCLSGVDYDKDNMLVVYHLYSFVHKHKLVIKTSISKSNPVVPTLYDVWATAEWHEREAYDLLGITFSGHPDLRRILLPDDWTGFPLKKDYKVPEFYNGMKVPY